jgi:hypothetical protein
MHKHHHPGLLVVDIQGKLARLVEESDALIATARLVQGARVLGLPVVWLEQNPDKLGATVPELQSLQAGDLVLPKYSFGALGSPLWRPRWPRGGSSIGWYVASRPISASTRACWDFWPAAPGSRWWWMRCRLAPCQPGSRHRSVGGPGAALTSVEMCLYELMGTAAIRHFARSSPW